MFFACAKAQLQFSSVTAGVGRARPRIYSVGIHNNNNIILLPFKRSFFVIYSKTINAEKTCCDNRTKTFNELSSTAIVPLAAVRAVRADRTPYIIIMYIMISYCYNTITHIMLLRAHTPAGVRKKSWTLFGSAPGRRRRPGGFADLDLNTPASVINYRLVRRCDDDVVEPHHDNIITGKHSRRKTIRHAFLGRIRISYRRVQVIAAVFVLHIIYNTMRYGGVCATTAAAAGAGEIIRQKFVGFRNEF